MKTNRSEIPETFIASLTGLCVYSARLLLSWLALKREPQGTLVVYIPEEKAPSRLARKRVLSGSIFFSTFFLSFSFFLFFTLLVVHNARAFCRLFSALYRESWFGMRSTYRDQPFLILFEIPALRKSSSRGLALPACPQTNRISTPVALRPTTRLGS